MAKTEMVRVKQMSGDERLAVNVLSHRERLNALVQAGQIKMQDALPQTLETILKKADTAWYEWDGYYIYVSDEITESNGYAISICKEAMPPHVNEFRTSIDEVEQYLDNSLGYTRDSRVWKAVEREDY